MSGGLIEARILGITGVAKGYDFVTAMLRLQPDVGLHHVEADDRVSQAFVGGADAGFHHANWLLCPSFSPRQSRLA